MSVIEAHKEVKDVLTQLTSEGRLNIPKALLNKVYSVGGSYDVSIDGSIKYLKKNKDGRIRLPKSLVGNKGPNFLIEIGSCKGGNCIKVDSI
jgi:hypothetical protein